MSELLLTTKLTIPTIHQNIVNRQRLVDRINDGMAYPLTLISCPAGFGKTTLLSEWAGQVDVPVGWLTLEQDDNDISRFIQYLYASVQSIKPDIPDLHVDLISGSHWGLATLVPLINNLNNISSPLALVLDDYQEITLPAVHNVLIYLLEHSPKHMHLIIASRADPPFPLARFRVRGQLNEIRATDLRFTYEETATFNNQIMNLGVRPEDVSILESRTEGWIAGLQLAALSMKGKHDISAFIAGFTGSHEFIVDYLTDEVLNQQTEKTKNFLLSTSILKRLTGPLCNALTGEVNGQLMLEDLVKANLFVTTLDNQRQWYRYHRLFADLLRQRLYEADPQMLSTLHQKASKWYQDQGMFTEAIDHALVGTLYERAVKLIGFVAETMLMRSEVTTLLSWFNQIPVSILNDYPSLSIFYSWAAILDGTSLKIVEGRLENVNGLEMQKADSFRAYANLFNGRIYDAQVLAERALKYITKDEHFLKSITTWILNLAKIMNTDLRGSKQQLEDIASVIQPTGNTMLTILTLCNIAEMTMRQGQLHQAYAMYKRVLTFSEDDSGQLVPVSGMAYLGLAALAREWGNFEEAISYVEKGMVTAEVFGMGSQVEAYIHLARIYQSQGEYEASQTTFKKATELAQAYQTSDIDDQFVGLLSARLWIVMGSFERVKQWMQHRELGTLDTALVTDYYSYHFFHHEYLTVARLRLAEGQPAEALDIFETLLVLMDQWGWLQSRREIELQVLRSVALYNLGKIKQALSTLKIALEIAEPGGYIRTFIEEGLPIKELLKKAVVKDILPAYAHRLLAVFEEDNHSQVDVKHGLLDSLSERELEVLRLMAVGLSNPEIARQLIVATGTIKAHTSNIYSKLGVKNRISAVQRAHELHII